MPRRTLEKQQPPVILDLCLTKTRSGKSRHYCDVIVSKSSVFECLPSKQKQKADVFKFHQFEERLQKARRSRNNAAFSNFSRVLWTLKDVRAHCYCASLVRTLYMTWRVPCHVFQARTPSRNSTKYRADDLGGNLICEYFCWMLGDTHFFSGRSLPFLILFIILKNKEKICAWEVLIISHILFK